MYPYSYLPKPLRTVELYVLMALSHNSMHAYGIIGVAHKDSLGSVNIPTGKLYPLLTRLCEEGLVDMINSAPAGKSGKERLHYEISEHGKIRLQEEAQRLRQAVEIMQRLGLFENDVPTDIQRLLLGAKTHPET